MPDNLTVVVGMNYDYGNRLGQERINLAAELTKQGYQVEFVEGLWPRDKYILHQGRYVCTKDEEEYGEGGLFRQGLDYLIVSEGLLRRKEIGEEKAREEMAVLFPDSRIYFVPEGAHPELKETTHGHIDLSTLLLPLDKLLIVDKSFYTITQGYKRKFEEIADKEQLDLRFYDPEAGGFMQDIYPLNCLVLPDGRGREKVFANKNTPPFVKLLRQRGIEVVTIPFRNSTFCGGSINCATNVREEGKDLGNLDLISLWMPNNLLTQYSIPLR